MIFATLALVGVTWFAMSGSSGITFAMGGLNLTIDSKGFYNGVKVPSATWKLKNLVPGTDKFFNFDDVKPGDYGCDLVSMHVQDDDAYMCMDFKNFAQDENGVNEPESQASGKNLADGTEFFGWMDDGDGKYEPPSEKALFGTSTQAASSVLNNTTYAIADARRGNSCKKDSARYVGMCWCAGDLVVQPDGKFTCDPNTLGNSSQTDSFSVDVEIRATPEKYDKKFSCGGNPPVNPPCEKCGGKDTRDFEKEDNFRHDDRFDGRGDRNDDADHNGKNGDKKDDGKKGNGHDN
ncbi:MAG: hypothetical protein RL681_338 [Candidatus Parcubacteria bacterium]